MQIKLTVIVLLMVLSGCSSMPLSTMYKLRKFDPLTQDPKALQLAVVIPKSIDLTLAHVVMLMGFDAEDDQSDIHEQLKFTLQDYERPPADLFYNLKHDERLIIVSFAPEEIERMRQLQKEITIKKDSDIKGSGYVGFNINGFCLSDLADYDSLIASFFIKIDANEDYMLLIDKMNLADQELGAEEILCSNWGKYQEQVVQGGDQL
ncbi:hypothetical protein QWI17_08530 [Gilvimarinus sp. SDUM040013]|uniref:Lipoprotein n=1 Tax=Gilvimarinus gilvus TaxID=3058038 RepID=A0ABU4S2J9_9GAMM|nr:hypothetical protein [Gilvimarinus sp. SDUM040013]MDO3385881.1 hypothetical protein [Gilvimarinus sp. SDUM040013]MDX6850616.1 hypothetical protein [Gilvimarinus sp. SDUM040013]